MHPAIGLVLSYVLGSLPFAYLAGRMLRGIDLREHGSGNLGATNVYRVLGWKVALAVFLLDTAKGALPVALLPRWTETGYPVAWAVAFGVAAILGHTRSMFLLFKGGGKGVATAGGVFLALAPVPSLIAMATFIAVLLGWGYVSLGSLAAALVLPLALLVLEGARSPIFLVSVLVAVFVFYTHRANIRRLRQGEESRFGRKAAT